jgi:glycosyltransferase involved in cell wall biosynthesis
MPCWQSQRILACRRADAIVVKIVAFTHPSFLPSQSMPRFASMLCDAFTARGHEVAVWAPRPCVYRWLPAGRWSKWLGYVDQFVIFPAWVRRELQRGDHTNTLFVFMDQALGPWVPLVAERSHVVHCHDLMALRSALGLIEEKRTSWTGRVYQRYIRAGFQRAKHFICVSENSREELVRFGGVRADTLEVVYNGLNQPFAPIDAQTAHQTLIDAGLPIEADGLLLHVGGGQWYKNTEGVIRLYGAYAARHARPLPLYMVSPAPSESVRAALATVPPQGRVRFCQNVADPCLRALYSVAKALIFPSLDEGFGWPIVEGLASGCPVLTTGRAPMTEVGGSAAHYLPRLAPHAMDAWATAAAEVLEDVLTSPAEVRSARQAEGFKQAAKFQGELAIDRYLEVYEHVLALKRAGASKR